MHSGGQILILFSDFWKKNWKSIYIKIDHKDTIFVDFSPDFWTIIDSRSDLNHFLVIFEVSEWKTLSFSLNGLINYLKPQRPLKEKSDLKKSFWVG